MGALDHCIRQVAMWCREIASALGLPLPLLKGVISLSPPGISPLVFLLTTREETRRQAGGRFMPHPHLSTYGSPWTGEPLTIEAGPCGHVTHRLDTWVWKPRRTASPKGPHPQGKPRSPVQCPNAFSLAQESKCVQVKRYSKWQVGARSPKRLRSLGGVWGR